MKRAPVVIIGVGNYLLGDEGAGIHAVALLRGRSWPAGVEILDGGTAGVGLLHLIDGRRLAVIIDCADFGGAPGEIRSFDAEDLARDERSESGLHAVDLLTALALARKTVAYPARVVIVGIQPKSIAMGTTLSPDVQSALARLPEILTKLVA